MMNASNIHTPDSTIRRDTSGKRKTKILIVDDEPDVLAVLTAYFSEGGRFEVMTAQQGADAVMIGRGAYGRPWIAAAIDRALAANDDLAEPGLAERLGIVLEHLADSLRFYGDTLGLKVFRKHLGWYIEQAPCPASPDARRAGRSTMCRMESAREVEGALTALWSA